MHEDRSEPAGADEKLRRTVIAVASWLCGAIEGQVRDNADMALTEALDCWLRLQKRYREILYTGQVTCRHCGQSWECLTLSTEPAVQCPHCGSQQQIPITPAAAAPSEPVNRKALGQIQQDVRAVVARIAALTQLLNDSHDAMDR